MSLLILTGMIATGVGAFASFTVLALSLRNLLLG
jgi:hypothetical protein